MAFTYKYLISELTVGKRNLFQSIPGTDTLVRFARCPDLSLKTVSSMQEAVSCGGVFLFDPGSDRWLMLAGKNLTAALEGGEINLRRIEKVKLKVQPRRPHPFRVKYGTSQPALVMPATITSERTGVFQTVLGDELWVFGVLTKAHGYGYGMPVENGKFALQGHYLPSDVTLPPGNLVSQPVGVPRMVGSYEDGFFADRIKSNGWVLYPELHLGRARKYFNENRAAIIAEWKRLGAPEDEVMAFYEDTFSAAVETTFGADEQLYVHIPFFGGKTGTDASFDSDLRIVRDTPVLPVGCGWTDNDTWGVEDSNLATARQRKWENSAYFSDYGFNAVCARPALSEDSAFTYPLSAAPDELRFTASTFVKMRGLIATVSPVAALSMGVTTGLVDARDVLSDYASVGEVGSLYGSATDLASYDQSVGNVRGKINIGDSLYLGAFMSAIHKFADVWDRLAQDSARVSQ